MHLVSPVLRWLPSLFALGASGMALASCISTPPAPAGVGVGVDGGPTEPGDVDGGEADATTTPDGAPSCGDSETSCGGTCVDLQSSAMHCGKCDHDCGGGACTAGVCQAVKLVDKLPPTTALDVTEDAFYFTNGATAYACQAAGCAGAQTSLCSVDGEIADGLAYAKGSLVLRHGLAIPGALRKLSVCKADVASAPALVGGGAPWTVGDVGANEVGRVVWASVNAGKVRVSVTTCASGACQSAVDLKSPDAVMVQPDIVAVGLKKAFVRSPGKDDLLPAQDFWRIGPGPNDAPEKVGFVNGDVADTKAMRAMGDGLAVAISARDNGGDYGQLYVCGSADSPGGPESGCLPRGDRLPPIVDMTLDLTRFYFSGEKEIVSCPREGCKGSPPIVAAAPALVPGSLHATSKYLYWISGTNERAIWRIAKP